MPQAIPLIATFAATLGTGTIAATAIYYGVSAALYLGVSIGLQFLAQAFMRPSGPTPEDVQNSLRQSAQPRVRHYGRVKSSGPWIFGDTKEGRLYKLLAIGQGPIDAIEQYWIDDQSVTLDGTDAGNASGFDGRAEINTRLGLPTETPYQKLLDNFPEWTANHRGDGLATLLAVQTPVEQERFLEIFPNGFNTTYRLVIRGAAVWNPVDRVTRWTDNAALIILDYMQHRDGMRMPSSIFNTPQALASWKRAAEIAAENVSVADGGGQDRYKIWGSYYLNERPADVIGRMLAACDGRLSPTADGGLRLDVGEWREPTVILGEDDIVGFSDLARGKDILNTANTIRATYTGGHEHDYQTAEADPWVDSADISLRGEIETELSLAMVPLHPQVRRLMKIAAYRANPQWVGTFQFNLGGLAALGERLVRIRYPLFGIDEVFEVQDLRIIAGEGNIMQGVALQVSSMPKAAYDWTTGEEGVPPIAVRTNVDHTIPVPSGFTATKATRVAGTATVYYAKLAWTPPSSAGLRGNARGRKIGAASWTSIPVASGDSTADSFVLDDGQTFEFQVRFNGGAWTASQNVTAAP